MNAVLRILGFHAVGELARQLPASQARMVTVALAVIANLLPVVGVLMGWMSGADVFVAYWLETVVIGAFTIVRIVTAAGDPQDTPGRRAGSVLVFVVMFGLLTFLQGMFLVLVFGKDATIVASVLEQLGFYSTDDEIPGGRGWMPVTVGLVVSHLVALLLNWFARGERRLHGAEQALLLPFPRLVPVLAVMSINALLLVVLVNHLPVLPVLVLVAAKLSLELGHTSWLERIPGVSGLLPVRQLREKVPGPDRSRAARRRRR